MSSILHIKDEEARELLDIQELFNELEEAMKELSREESTDVVMPQRTVMMIKPKSGYMMVMPAIYYPSKTMTCKMLTMYPGNTDHPSHCSHIAYYDTEHGQLEAILDGDYITAMRTAVASAIATKHLSRPGSSVLAVLGSGVQADSHIKVFKLLFPELSQINIWSRTPANAQALCDSSGAIYHSTIKSCVQNADVIITATSSHTPILMSEWVQDHAHINAVGAPKPHMQELSPDLVQRSRIYADSRSGVELESGDVIHAKGTVYAELGEVILGVKDPCREQLTLFKSVGIALEDAVAAKLVYQAYTSRQQCE